MKGYLDDLESTTSDTETFVAIKAEIANWRWAGVPFYLRTRQALGRTGVSEIVDRLPSPIRPFDLRRGGGSRSWPTSSSSACKPDEGVKQWIIDQGSGTWRHAAERHVPLDMQFRPGLPTCVIPTPMSG